LPQVEHTVFTSAQRVELYAVVPQQLNLFFQLCSLVWTCLYPCFVSYLHSHSNLLVHLLTVMPGQIT
jgi:hypothetical protein